MQAVIGICVVLLGVGIGAWVRSSRSSSSRQQPVSAAPSAIQEGATTTTPPEPVPTAAVLSAMKGDVRILRGGKTYQAEPKSELHSGDRLIVSTTGTADIIWPSYGRTRLDGGATLDITDAQMNADHSRITVQLRVMAGRIWTRLERLLGDDSTFRVRVSNTVATVRGTSFGVWKKDKRVGVLVVESHVTVTRVEDKAGEGGTNNEVPIGPERRVGPWEKIVTQEDLTQDEPNPQAMTGTDKRDAFIVASNETMTPAELDIETTNIPSDSTLQEMPSAEASPTLTTEPSMNPTPDQPTSLEPAPTEPSPTEPSPTEPPPLAPTQPEPAPTQPVTTDPNAIPAPSTDTQSIENFLDRTATPLPNGVFVPAQ